MTTKLPVEKRKEKFDKAEFINLAKKVKKIFEKEAKYVQKEEKRNGTINNSTGVNFLS